jgi:hypothetical protein
VELARGDLVAFVVVFFRKIGPHVFNEAARDRGR